MRLRKVCVGFLVATLLVFLPDRDAGMAIGEDDSLGCYKIYVIADVHYFGKNATQKRAMMRQNCFKWLTEFRDRAKTENANAIFQLGDLVDPVYDFGKPAPSSLVIGYMNESMNILRASGIPVYSVLGNHEINLNGTTKSDVSGILGLPSPPYMSFDIGEFHFITLDSFNRSSLWGVPHHEHFMLYSTEIAWLKTDLKENRDKPTIVLTHIPLSGRFENVTDVYYRRYNSHRNGREVRELLKRYGNVIAVLEAHYHNIVYNDTSLYTAYVWKDSSIRYVGIPSLINQYSQNCYGILELNYAEETFRLEITSEVGKIVEFTWHLVNPDTNRTKIMILGILLLVATFTVAILLLAWLSLRKAHVKESDSSHWYCTARK